MNSINEQEGLHTYEEVKGNENRDRAIKWLAVFGVISIVLSLGWIVSSITGYNPNLMATIGSIFTNKSHPVELILTPATTTIEHGSPVTLEWEPAPEPGTYALWFECAGDMEIHLATPGYGSQEIICDTFYNIGELNAVRAIFSNEKESTLIDYKVAFLPESNPDEQYITTGQLTIQSSQIALSPDDKKDADIIESEPIIKEEEPKSKETETPTETEIDQPETEVTEDLSPEPVYTEPQFITEVVYQLPTSDPLGNTYLYVSYRGVGIIDNNVFTAHSSFNSAEHGAIRFDVTNRGTKTSSEWTYRAQLPNGQIYTSPTQEPLKPNETATISIGFRSPVETGTYPFSVEIDTIDTNELLNDNFTWSVMVN